MPSLKASPTPQPLSPPNFHCMRFTASNESCNEVAVPCVRLNLCVSVFLQASPPLPPWSTPSYCGFYLTPLLPPHIPSAISPLSTVIAGQDCVRSWWHKNGTAEQWRRLIAPSLCCVWTIMNQQLHLTSHTHFCTTMELTGGTLVCALVYIDLEHPLSSLLPPFPPSLLLPLQVV